MSNFTTTTTTATTTITSPRFRLPASNGEVKSYAGPDGENRNSFTGFPPKRRAFGVICEERDGYETCIWDFLEFSIFYLNFTSTSS